MKRTVKAFTLIEILIVTAIMAILFVILGVFGTISRRAFVASQTLKELVVSTRSTRRQSMLVTKNVGENWVHAVGIEMFYDASLRQWKYYQVKLQHTSPSAESNTFYIPYPAPASINSYTFNRFGDIKLVDANATFIFYRPNSTTLICGGTGSKLRIMFKSVNGTPVIYCNTTDITSFGGIDLGTSLSKTKITIRTDGNISALLQ